MKILAVLSVIVAVAASYPVVKTWTLQKLSKAIETKSDPALQPYLEEALNMIMFNLFTGKGELSQYTIPSPSGASKWTIDELMAAKANYPADVNDDYCLVAITQAIAIYKQKKAMGEVLENVEVTIPAMDISVWTLDDLKEALNSDSVNPELKPRLEKALSELETTGDDAKNTIGLVTRVGLIPHKNPSVYGKKLKTKKDYRFKHLYKRPYY